MPGYSIQEREFLKHMAPSIKLTPSGNIQVPLPFTIPSLSFHDNRKQAYHRTHTSLKRLQKEPSLLASCLEKMETYIKGPVPKFHLIPAEHRRPPSGQANYLPLFWVKQGGKARIVFDAAATFGPDKKCINQFLNQGPDINNKLLGVVCRFRRYPVAFMADVESMFYQFFIPPDQATFLRFFWFQDNDPLKPLVEYWSRVHLMGLTSSPTVAKLCLRYAAMHDPPPPAAWIREDDLLDPAQRRRSRESDPTEDFIVDGFYVDDGLASAETGSAAKDLLIT